MARKRDGRPPLRPKRASRLHKIRVWIERGILGVMMTVVAWVVERRLMRVLKTGNSSKRALQKAERDARRDRSDPNGDREAGVRTSPDKIDVEV
ncbi:MAG TPA: hypothetical protein VID47_18335 [Actinomycetota bacterium]|jgi:hypothetical protein